MKKRLITGILYVAVLVGFFFLRMVDSRLFGILIYAFGILGTYEMVRAVSEVRRDSDGNSIPPAIPMSVSQKAVVWVYALINVPLYYLVEFLAGGSGTQALLGLFLVFAVVCLSLLVLDYHRTTLAGTGAALLCGLYPTAILSTMVFANGMGTSSTLALLLIFVISPVADTFAFVTGSLLKGKKMCPQISPNKTVSGCVGGVVFGTGSAVLLYWLYTLITEYVYTGIGSGWAGAPWLFFALLGLATSVFTEFGDLVESIIKRRLGIKDMGKLLPGHGGILDRIDGTLYASLIVYFAFLIFVI